MFEKFFGKGLNLTFKNRFAQFTHQMEKKVHIVGCYKDMAQDLSHCL